jgi:hypothetical protein
MVQQDATLKRSVAENLVRNGCKTGSVLIAAFQFRRRIGTIRGGCVLNAGHRGEITAKNVGSILRNTTRKGKHNAHSAGND